MPVCHPNQKNVINTEHTTHTHLQRLIFLKKILIPNKLFAAGGLLRRKELLISMYSRRGECRKTNSDILGAPFVRRTVAHPLTGSCNNGLAGFHFDHSIFVFYLQASAQDKSNLLEFGLLAGFNPTGRRYHPCHTHFGYLRNLHGLRILQYAWVIPSGINDCRL